MSRGFLSHEEQEKVVAQLPDLAELWSLVGSLNPEIISMKCPHESDIPVAAVALADALDALAQARYALGEALEHRIWYNVKKSPPDPMSGTWFEGFYLGDAAM